MAIFVTGTTGYLGSYVAAGLLAGYPDKLNLLVRAKICERHASVFGRRCNCISNFLSFSNIWAHASEFSAAT